MGSLEGEPFDVGNFIELAEKLQRIRTYRRIFGDKDLEELLGEDPGIVEARLAEKARGGRNMLEKLART